MFAPSEYIPEVVPHGAGVGEGCGVAKTLKYDPGRTMRVEIYLFVFIAVSPVSETEPGTHSWYSLHIY